MKILFLPLLLLVYVSSYAQEKITEANISFTLPDTSWALKHRDENGVYVVYTYKRTPITDKEGHKVVANISFLAEDVMEDVSVIDYSAQKTAGSPFKVKEVISTNDKSGRLNFSNAIAYKGTYNDRNEMEHTIYIVHLINNQKGVQVIMDVTSSLFPQCEKEFIAVMQSIKKM